MDIILQVLLAFSLVLICQMVKFLSVWRTAELIVQVINPAGSMKVEGWCLEVVTNRSERVSLK